MRVFACIGALSIDFRKRFGSFKEKVNKTNSEHEKKIFVQDEKIKI